MYREWGNHGHAMLAVGTLDNLLKTDCRLKVDTSAMVEVTHRRDPNGEFEWIALYNHSGRLENSFHPPLPIQDIQLSLQAGDKKVQSVKSLKNGRTIPFTTKKNGRIETTLSRLDCYDIVLVTY